MRRLIICADGTWNRPDETIEGVQTATNVAKLADAIPPVDVNGVSQVVFYRMGVGTGNASDKWLGGMFGSGLDEHIRDCYRFLVHNSLADDELYFFGFSRGAYTIRSLAGLIRNCGLLKRRFADQEDSAFEMYRDRGQAAYHPNGGEAAAFRASYAHDPVPITCIGVWDTVGALGLPIELFGLDTQTKYGFHDVTLSSRVKNAFHAIAIDEHRKAFAPTLWEQPVEDLEKNWLEQAWFCGVHSNVGGGYPDASLSDITLRWMIERVTDRCRLQFDQALIDATTNPLPTGTLYDSMSVGYKMIGRLERQIDQQAISNRARGVSTWEYVHDSAGRRLEQTAAQAQPYRPQNLSNYLRRPQPKPLVLPKLVSAARRLLAPAQRVA
jgi:uncharacterized protein (DUF2235 family)